MKLGTKLLATLLATAVPGAANAAYIVTNDPILYWSQIALANTAGAGPAQVRALAMVNLAMYDAVNAASGSVNRGYIQGVSTLGGDTRAAATMAAYNVLAGLYSTDSTKMAAFMAARDASLALVTDGAAKTNGINTGTAYANAMLGLRANDGSGVSAPYTTTGLPGDYRPTPPGNVAPSVPQYADVTPFLQPFDNAFRPGPPPALNSAEYTTAYNDVKSLGSFANSTRTSEQTAAASFWGNLNSGSWYGIALEVSGDEGLSTLAYAKLFGQLAAGQADAVFASWDAKYFYRLWRPVTAIQLGDADTNPDTAGDPNWLPYVNGIAGANTPPYPDYFSTAAAISQAVASVLIAGIGDESFCYSLGAVPVNRCEPGFQQAAKEAADSRIWSGIHFRFATEAGLKAGGQIGSLALTNGAFSAAPEPSTWLTMIVGFGMVGAVMRRRRTALRVRYV